MWPDHDTVGINKQNGDNPTSHQVIAGIKLGHFWEKVK